MAMFVAVIIDHKGDLHPQIVLEDASGKPLDVYYLPERAYIDADEGAKVSAGTVLAKTPREASGIKDITGGLPRVTEIFEARKPKDPAVIAEVDGTVEILGEKKRGKRTIIVKSESGIEREHLVPHGKRFLVHSGDCGSSRPIAGRWSFGTARYPASLGRRGGAAVPGPRSSGRLPIATR